MESNTLTLALLPGHDRLIKFRLQFKPKGKPGLGGDGTTAWGHLNHELKP